MNSFEIELRTLVDVWRQRGTLLSELIEVLNDEVENLEELESLGEK